MAETMLAKVVRAIREAPRPNLKGNELSKTIGDLLDKISDEGYLHEGEDLATAIARAAIYAMHDLPKDFYEDNSFYDGDEPPSWRDEHLWRGTIDFILSEK